MLLNTVAADICNIASYYCIRGTTYIWYFLPRSTLIIRFPRLRAISSIDSCVINALKVARTTLNWLPFPCTALAVQLVMPKYFRISHTRGFPRSPRCVACIMTLHELDRPTKSRVKALFWYRSTKKMLRLHFRDAANTASRAAGALPVPNPPQPFRFPA